MLNYGWGIVFIAEITARAFIIADSNKRRTLSRSDIAKALSKSDQFDFLIDIVPRDDLPFPGAGGANAGIGGANANNGGGQLPKKPINLASSAPVDDPVCNNALIVVCSYAHVFDF